MTKEQYRARREKIGSMRAVAKLLGVFASTIHARESGLYRVTKEAELALFSLPLKKVCKK